MCTKEQIQEVKKYLIEQRDAKIASLIGTDRRYKIPRRIKQEIDRLSEMIEEVERAGKMVDASEERASGMMRCLLNNPLNFERDINLTNYERWQSNF